VAPAPQLTGNRVRKHLVQQELHDFKSACSRSQAASAWAASSSTR
jgi:hypothetical protein